MLLSVESRNATCNHVVVVWKKMVIDYEAIHTYTLRRVVERGLWNSYNISLSYKWVWDFSIKKYKSVEGKQ